MSKTPKTPATPARLTALEARQAELEKRIAELERAANRQMPGPWFPAQPATPHWPEPKDWPNLPEVEPGCHICGIKWKDATHYVCSNDRCPNRVWCGDSAGPSFGTIATDQSAVFSGPSHFAGATIHAVGQTPENLPK